MKQAISAGHYQSYEDLDCAHRSCRGKKVALNLDLRIPNRPKGPIPLVIWVHGGISTGAITASNAEHRGSYFGLPGQSIRALVTTLDRLENPCLYTPAQAPFHVLHSQNDDRADIASIRKIAEIGGERRSCRPLTKNRRDAGH